MDLNSTEQRINEKIILIMIQSQLKHLILWTAQLFEIKCLPRLKQKIMAAMTLIW